MGLIADTEDAILAAVTGALGATVRETGSVPGGWTLDTLRRVDERDLEVAVREMEGVE